jgi:1-acyl-sn-glycerol-3-phosphate acyltransferase
VLRAAATRVEVENAERIEPGRPHILVVNHVSYFDVLALLGYLPGRNRFVGKKELTRIPLWGAAWMACGHISIDRQDKMKAMESLALARRKLAEDRPTVVLFPEGTRSVTGELRAFKKGAFVLAIQTGTDVIPAAILGTGDIMRKGSLAIRRGRTIRVRIGEPIPVEGLRLEDRDELTRRAHDAVAALQSLPG